MVANSALHDGERLELILDYWAFTWHDANAATATTNAQQLFYSAAQLRKTRQTEYPRSTVHVWYLCLYEHAITVGHAERGRIKSWLLLYMAPYSEWMGCGSGITKNCEWLKAERRVKEDPYQGKKKNWVYSTKEKVYSREKKEKERKKFCHENDAIQKRLCGHRHMPDTIQQSSKNNTKGGYNTGTYRSQWLANQAEMGFARGAPPRAPNRRVRTEAKLRWRARGRWSLPVARYGIHAKFYGKWHVCFCRLCCAALMAFIMAYQGAKV